MLKKRTLLLEKVYETRIMFFSSSFYCMDNLQDLAGYRVSMDRENNKNKGNTLGRNKTKAGEERAIRICVLCCSCNLELVVDVGIVVFTTSVTGSLQIVGRLSIVLGHSTLLVATECVSTEV
jgi:hypothetical protein